MVDTAAVNIEVDTTHSSLDRVRQDSAHGINGEPKDGLYNFAVARKTRMHDIGISEITRVASSYAEQPALVCALSNRWFRSGA